MKTFDTLDLFTRAYIVCSLWSSMDNADDHGGEPLDANYGPEDISESTLERMAEDCAAFQRDNATDLAAWSEAFGSDEQAGHDFWLTRNRHGAGFWDRFSGGHPLHDTGRRLTDSAHAWGSFDLYVGDDGKIYGS